MKAGPDRAITDGGAGTAAPSIVTRQPENALFTRAQLEFEFNQKGTMLMTDKNSFKLLITFTAALALSLVCSFAKDIKLLNVSYDPTRELYKDFNAAFTRYWTGKTGDTVTIQLSNDGSGKQARS